MSLAALFTVGKKKRNPSVHRRIDKVWHRHTAIPGLK